MTNSDIPADLANAGPFGAFMRRVLNCLRRRTPVSSQTVQVEETASGFKLQVNLPTMQIWYLPLCKQDGTRQYIPVFTAGKAIDEAALPPDANVYDPPA